MHACDMPVEAGMHACDMPEGGRGWWMLTATWDPRRRERGRVSVRSTDSSLFLSLSLGLEGWARRLGGWAAGWRAMRWR